ncbi:protein transport protein Sec24B isoform X2 [Latimeria chalumnae]|uniref:protein transport protein Sec24B isoform X2 n=1 Tax=Latimeria chalumnae TaxID=7897 RepID=UPI00313DC7D6
MSAPAGFSGGASPGDPPRRAGVGGNPTLNGGVAAQLYQNGPMQNQMQLPAGYGATLQNYSASPGHYSQVPNKVIPSSMTQQYGGDYYPSSYQMSPQNSMRSTMGSAALGVPQGALVASQTLGLSQGFSQGGMATSSGFLYTPASQPVGYTTSGGHYGSSVSYPAASASQGVRSQPGHDAMHTGPKAVYPNFSRPSMPLSNQYGQALTSQAPPNPSQIAAGVLAAQATPLSSAPLQRDPSRHVPMSTWPSSTTMSAPPTLSKSYTGSSSVNSQGTAAPLPSVPNLVNQNYPLPKPAMGPPPASGTPPIRPPPPAAASTPSSGSPAPPHPATPPSGADTSSTTSSASSVPNNYDALEGGGYPEPILSANSVPAPTASQNSKTAKPFGCGYPALQPAYSNTTAPPPLPVSQPSNLGCPPGYQSYTQPYSGVNQLSTTMGGLSMYNLQQPESLRPVNLMQERNVLPPTPVQIPVPNLNPDLKKLNCSSDSFRCTLTNIPQTQAMLNKAKLPLGLLLHPFRDLTQLPVITSSTIVRCRSCRTYINPFVSFLDQRRWKCNLCFRVNDVPEEFMYNPLTRSYGEPHKRPEVQNSTVEFIASSDYMLRPPQPAVYLFVLDVSHSAVEAGYLNVVCHLLLENLDKLPGDSRTRIGFITFDSTIHFYNLQEGLSQPQMLIVSDIDDIFIPTPDSLLVNLHESKEPGAQGCEWQRIAGWWLAWARHPGVAVSRRRRRGDLTVAGACGRGRSPPKDTWRRFSWRALQWDIAESMLVKDLLNALPHMFTDTRETHSALGPSLQAAYKLMAPTGGRISVFQTQLPSLGAGLLHSREDPNQRSSTKGVQHLGPATDFYKKLALDCSGQQIAVDLFLLSSQYSDLASLACISKYSAGSIYYYPSFHHIHNPSQTERLQKDLKRYLTRKIGFEAVMRIRCTKGLSIHTFHGNFFVRSTDLLSLANVNPDSGFAVQMSIEESLTDTSLACFQAALLYTSSKGERRIRVHTLCLPVVNSLTDVYAGADVQAVICLLANMAVDRSVSSSLPDAKDALMNAAIDSLSAYQSTVSNPQVSALIAPYSLRLFPLFILALLKQKAFRTGTSTRLDDRVFAMCEIKCQPLVHLLRMIHPNLYRIDRLTEEGTIHFNDKVVPQPPLQQLSAERLTKEGAFLMDCGAFLYLWVGKNCDNTYVTEVLGCPNYASIPQTMMELPELDTPLSERTRGFISWLRDSRTLNPVLHVIRDDSPAKNIFFQHLIEDRTEAAFSYYEFLLHIQQQISK